MKVLLDDNNYILSYALIGNLGDEVEVDDPEDLEFFEPNFEAFRVESGKLIYDEDKSKEIARIRTIENLTSRRISECFNVINRSQLWYNTLSEDQKAELQVWYQAWLDVTDTLVVPTKPDWLR